MKELLDYWPSLSLLVVSVIAYGIKELQSHGKLKWMASPIMSHGHADFWGSQSWKRKYKHDNGSRFIAPKNLYYRFFKIDYQERFPLSATLLVSLTDGYHFSQWVFTKCLFAAIALAVDGNFLYWFFGLWIVWSITFNITYKVFSR